ncbi:chitinase-like protein EN03 [Halyomorpha halys]|uniref:chitinase-like protein EN03 n=1 Tax=Halyomorpha halys TaxID=286706 RepID=UPI0006D4CF46
MQFLLLLFLAVVPAFESRVICYWNGKSFWREGTAKVTVDDLKPGLSHCTHLIYGYAAINDDNYHLEPIDKKLDLDTDKGQGLWKKVAALKKAQPGLLILLSVGGYEDTDDMDKYLDVLEKPARRTAFVDSVVELLAKYGFDGIDLAWQFPHQEEKTTKSAMGSIWQKITSAFGSGVDKKASLHRDFFIALCRELKAELRPDNRILSLAVLPHINATAYFDVRSLIPYVDMVNLWTVDFKTPDRTPDLADYVHPLTYAKPRLEHQNAEAIVRHWLNNGAEPHKLNIGVATWGRSWVLTRDSGLSGSPPLKADGAGEKGPHTKTKGLLAYYEICTRLVSPTNPKAPEGSLRKVSQSERSLGTYCYSLPDRKVSEGLWVGFEEPQTAAAKAALAKTHRLGGIAVLDLALDDPRGICDGNKFPITKAAKLNFDFAISPAFPAKVDYFGKKGPIKG